MTPARCWYLVLIDQDVIERAADLARQFRHRHQFGPIQQQVVVIEHLLALPGGDVSLTTPAILLPTGRTPHRWGFVPADMRLADVDPDVLFTPPHQQRRIDDHKATECCNPSCRRQVQHRFAHHIERCCDAGQRGDDRGQVDELNRA